MQRKQQHQQNIIFVHAHILPLGDYTYIKAVCPNQAYLKAFDKMEEYSVDEIELQDKNNKKHRHGMNYINFMVIRSR